MTLIATLSIIAALFLFLVATIFGAFGLLAGLVGALAGFGSTILIIYGIVSVALAYGFLGGRPWGWWMGIIMSGLLILSIALFDVLGLVAGLILVYYLTRPNVKIWFGVH